MRALILDAEARKANLQNVPKPSPRPNEVLVKVEAISLNPIDPLYVSDPHASSGRTIGSDFAGIVSSLGSKVPLSGSISVGDRVSGFLQGACSVNERPGAFAEYLISPHDLVWKIPENTSIEQAAGVSLVALTAAQVVWYRLGLETPFTYDHATFATEHPEWQQSRAESASTSADVLNFFIYGASTSVGLYAAQMVRLSAQASGRKINLFGTASKARWPMLRSEPYSYDYLVDYRDPDWAEQVKKLSDGAGMHFVYDCISEGDSVEKSASTLANHGRMAIMRSRQGGAWTAHDLPLEPIYGAVWEGLGEEITYVHSVLKRSPAARSFAVDFYRWLSKAMGSELHPVPIRLMPGDLEDVTGDGFQLLGAGNMEDRKIDASREWMKPVSAEKLVYRIAPTSST